MGLTLFRILYLPFSYLQTDTRYHVSRYFLFILYSFFISICLHPFPSPPPPYEGGLYSIIKTRSLGKFSPCIYYGKILSTKHNSNHSPVDLTTRPIMELIFN